MADRSTPQEESHEESDLVRWLNSYFGPNARKFFGPEAYDLAIGLANQQRSRWAQLFDIISRNELGSAQAALQTMRQLILKVGVSTPSKTGDGVIVETPLPLLQSDLSEEKADLIRKHPVLTLAFVIGRSAEFLSTVAQPQMGDVIIAASAARAFSFTSNPNSRHDESVQSLTKNVEAALAELATLKRSLGESFQNGNQQLSDLRMSAAAEMKELSKRAETERETATVERNAFITALRGEVSEYIKVESSISLWQRKANWHVFNFSVAALVFCGGLIVSIGLVLFGGVTSFIDRLGQIPADHQFLAVALLAIPTFGAAWLLRFVARMAIQNLSLAQDSRLRHAQIQTYLRLLGDPKKPIGEKERILALAALFRPLSGHGTDDVNPPTIADLLRESLDHLPRAKPP